MQVTPTYVSNCRRFPIHTTLPPLLPSHPCYPIPAALLQHQKLQHLQLHPLLISAKQQMAERGDARTAHRGNISISSFPVFCEPGVHCFLSAFCPERDGSCDVSVQEEFQKAVEHGFQASSTMQQGSIIANEAGTTGVWNSHGAGFPRVLIDGRLIRAPHPGGNY
eukprot:scaffold33637_cov24-Tisochrysis_lutea.AAC.1